MKRKVQISLLLLLAAVFSAFGQALPALPKASEITVGTLPDNVSYYLVNNTVSKGYADFALIRKSYSDIDASRAALSALPHFPDPSRVSVGEQDPGEFHFPLGERPGLIGK